MFEKYKLLKYSLTHDGKKLKDYILTDITTRAKLKAPEDALAKLKLKPGETPEMVSEELYGTPYYHWAVMMVNNIFDIHTEWFLADDQLYQYCVDKYNLSCTIPVTGVDSTTNTFTYANHQLQPNDAVVLSGDSLPTGLYENTLYYVFNTTEDTFQLTALIHDATAIDFGVATDPITITCDKLNRVMYWVDDQNNIVSSALDLYEGWSNNEDTRISYQNQITEIIYNQPSRISYIPATQKDIVESSTDVLDIVEEITPIDQVVTRNFRTMTNLEYEEYLNQRRQMIWVIKPEYIKTFISMFEKAIEQ